MKKADAELKARALAKDLVGKIAEHKGSKRKCKIELVEARPSNVQEEDFQVVCEFLPLHKELSDKKISEELDYFLSTYKIFS